jgi:hypothetical protein
MIIQYILNLEKSKNYFGSGSFELIGSALSNQAFPYAASGLFELFGSAQVIIGGYQFQGAGQFEITGTSSINIPQSSINLKFNLNDFGYSTTNQQYQVKQISRNASNPIYTATRLGNKYDFTNDSLLTVSEIQAFNSVNYKNKVSNYQEKIDIINGRLNSFAAKTNMAPPAPTSYNTKVNFTINQYFKDELLDPKKVEKIIGTSDAVMYKSDDKVFSQDKIYDNASSQIAYQNKLGNLLGSYSEKLDKITNMLNNINPVPITDSLLAVKFNINEYGKNANAYNEKVIQIYGVNDSLFYKTNQGTTPQRSFLTPPEEQTRNKKNYNSKIAYYNEKIQQINNIINN